MSGCRGHAWSGSLLPELSLSLGSTGVKEDGLAKRAITVWRLPGFLLTATLSAVGGRVTESAMLSVHKSPKHELISKKNGIGTVGVSDSAQETL